MTYTRLTYGTTRAKPTQCHTVCGKPIQKLPLKLDIGKTCLHELLSASSLCDCCLHAQLSATGPCKSASTVHAVDSINMFS